MMKELGKRCRSGLSRLIGGKNRTPVRYENELTLHLSKDELFDRRVLLPHAELNEAVYQAVDRFVKRYSGREMTLTIYCGPLSEPLQQTFREVYAAHYNDEYRLVRRFLNRRYLRVATLLTVVAVAYLTLKTWKVQLSDSFLALVLSNLSAFSLWEIGHTHFDHMDAAAERKRILRARDAEIRFE